MISLKSCVALIVVIFGICVGDLHIGNKAEYDSFLQMIDNQSKQDEERANRFFFAGTPSAEDLVRYSKDRHGQYFLKCVKSDTSVSSKTMNVRCPMRSAANKPGCHFTHDFTNEVTVQGCYDISSYDKTCNDECVVRTKLHTSEFGDKQSIIGFCCCVSETCNRKTKEQLEAAYEKYLAQPTESHHHHHHHHSHDQQTSSSWGRTRRF